MIIRKAEYSKCAMYECLYGVGTDELDLHVNYCGIEQCVSGHEFGPCIRQDHLIHVIKRGKGTYQINDRKYELSAGDVFYIPPEVTTIYRADDDDPWEYFWVGFGGLKAFETLHECGFLEGKYTRRVSPECMVQLEGYINLMLENHKMIISNELRRNACVMNFLSALIDDVEVLDFTRKQTHYPGTVYVRQAVAYMNLHFAEKIKVNDVADYIGINRGYLTNNFKKLMKISPQDYLINLRMEKAASLLKSTSLPINEIAVMVGYDDPLSFSKVFKQKCGMSPKSYRIEVEELKIITDESTVDN